MLPFPGKYCQWKLHTVTKSLHQPYSLAWCWQSRWRNQQPGQYAVLHLQNKLALSAFQGLLEFADATQKKQTQERFYYRGHLKPVTNKKTGETNISLYVYYFLQAFRTETYLTKWGIKLYNIDVLVLEENKTIQ